MKIGYAARRAAFYPWEGGTGWEFPPPEVRAAYLRTVRALGFAGVEIGLGQGVGRSEAEVRAVRDDLDAVGVPCMAVRAGGGFAHPRIAAMNHQRLLDAVQMATWLGAKIVNTALVTPPPDPHGVGAVYVGERVSQGSSRLARAEDFAVTARHLREIGAVAADAGIRISIEMHQRSIADNSWSCLHLLERIDHSSVGVNPDLGNLYWTYDEPEETAEACILALAPHAVYWHCKQFQRVPVPELHKAYFQRVPLPDGEIDYRFAITAMARAGYDGYLAIEGTPQGDQLTRDGRSLSYCREILDEIASEG
jgi:sugar phosphate isomerase/epimerase